MNQAPGSIENCFEPVSTLAAGRHQIQIKPTICHRKRKPIDVAGTSAHRVSMLLTHCAVHQKPTTQEKSCSPVWDDGSIRQSARQSPNSQTASRNSKPVSQKKEVHHDSKRLASVPSWWHPASRAVSVNPVAHDIRDVSAAGCSFCALSRPATRTVRTRTVRVHKQCTSILG